MAIVETGLRPIEVTSGLGLNIHKIVDGIQGLDDYIEDFREERGSLDNSDSALRQVKIRKSGLLLLAAMLAPYYPEHITVTVIGDGKRDIHSASQNVVEVWFSSYLTGFSETRYSGFLDLMAENIDDGDSTTVMQFLGEYRFVSDNPKSSAKRLFNEVLTVGKKLETETDPQKHASLLTLRDKLLIRVLERRSLDRVNYGVRRIPVLVDGRPAGEELLQFKIGTKNYRLPSTPEWEEQVELRGGFD